MKPVYATFLLLASAATCAQAQSRIVCEPTSNTGNEITAIWPMPYLSETGTLCFDVKGWPGYGGRNCVQNGQATWTGLVIVNVDGESQGRDTTAFRVRAPVLDQETIEYAIEWRREGDWSPMQRVKINRLSGDAVSYYITQHGGEPYRCSLAQRKL